MKRILSIIVIAGIIVAIILLSRGEAGSECKMDLVNAETVFDVVLHDDSCSQYSISDLVGTPVIVNSWASWCPFCIHEIPDFIKLQEEFADELVIVAINRQESIQSGQNYLRENDLEKGLVYLYDPSDQFYRIANLIGMPITLFIDVNGEIVDRHSGPLSLSQMYDKVETLFNITKE